MSPVITIIIVAVAAAAGAAVAVIIQRNMARSKAKLIISEAETQAEDIKRKKQLEGKEAALKITTDAEKQANQRLAKIQASENKIKQRELQLNQQQGENQRTRNELDSLRQQLDNRAIALDNSKTEIERMHHQAQEQLEIGRASCRERVCLYV